MNKNTTFFTITKKIILLILLVIFTALFIENAAIMSINSLMKNTNKIVTNDFEYNQIINEMAILALNIRRYEKDILLNIGDPDNRQLT